MRFIFCSAYSAVHSIYSGLRAIKSTKMRYELVRNGNPDDAAAVVKILLSFPAEVQPEIMIVPIPYGVTVAPLTGFMAWLFRRIPVKQ